MDRGAWRATVYGVTQRVRHNWSDLAWHGMAHRCLPFCHWIGSRFSLEGFRFDHFPSKDGCLEGYHPVGYYLTTSKHTVSISGSFLLWVSLGKWKTVPEKHGKGISEEESRGLEGRRMQGNNQRLEPISSCLCPSVLLQEPTCLLPLSAGRSLPWGSFLHKPITLTRQHFPLTSCPYPSGGKISLKCSKAFYCYYFLGNWK